MQIGKQQQAQHRLGNEHTEWLKGVHLALLRTVLKLLQAGHRRTERA